MPNVFGHCGSDYRRHVYYNYAMQPIQSEEMSGYSVFYKDAAGDIYHTYSCYARGGEKGLGTYMLLDLTPKGRNENGPNHALTDWVRHHDNYGGAGFVDSTGRYVADRTASAAASSPAGTEKGCNCAKTSA